MTKKILVALEGNPGGGKTSLMERLRNKEFIDGVAQILPDNDPTDATVTLEKILKSDHLKTQAFRESNKRAIVLDRYYQSTLSYHWAADRVYNENRFASLRQWALKSLNEGTLIIPDLTFYIDVPFDLSLKRKERVSYDKNPWTDRIFLEEMRKYYMNLFDSLNENIILIDGQKDIDMIELEIMNTILQQGASNAE